MTGILIKTTFIQIMSNITFQVCMPKNKWNSGEHLYQQIKHHSISGNVKYYLSCAYIIQPLWRILSLIQIKKNKWYSENHPWVQWPRSATFFGKSQLLSTNHNFFLEIATFFYNLETSSTILELFSTNHNFFSQLATISTNYNLSINHSNFL